MSSSLFKIVSALAVFAIIQSIDSFEIPVKTRESLRKLHDKCVAESGVTHETLSKCKNSFIPDDHSAKCYLKCFIEQATILVDQKLAVIEDIEHEISDDMHEHKKHIVEHCDQHIG